MDLGQLMQMAQTMKDQLAKAQGEAANVRVQGEAGAGMVRVTMSGRHEVLEVVIDAKAFAMGDKALLEDLVRAAMNQASMRVNEALKDKLGGMAAGMGLDLGALGIPGLGR